MTRRSKVTVTCFSTADSAPSLPTQVLFKRNKYIVTNCIQDGVPANVNMDEDDLIIEQEDGLAQFLPQGFGKQRAEINIAAQLESSKRHTSTQPSALRTSAQGPPDDHRDSDQNSDDGAGDSSDDDSDDDNPEDDYPISHEMTIKTHEKPVTTLTCDPSGSRLVSGSTDCTFKLHDFSSMTPNTIRAFKSVDPTATKASAAQEVHPVHHVSFNPLHPSSLLVVSATSQAKIFSRDGEELLTFNKGDMYLRDMHNTKGHVSEITTGAWNPTNAELLVTAGTDSTLRIWDVNNHRSQKETIVHKSRKAGSGGRTRMTAVAWGSPSQGGPNVLFGAGLDGSLVMWQGNGPYSRPVGEVREAHTPETWTSGVAISPDGRTVASRGGDDTIKLWDLRKFKTAISEVSHPSTSTQYPTSNIMFSPTGSSIITGSATGHLHILNPATLRPDVVTPVTPGSALITVLWHEKMNQILTGSADASTHVLYRPDMSAANKGAALVMARAPKKRYIDDDASKTTDTSQAISGDQIFVPGAMPAADSRKPLTGLTASGRSRDPRRPQVQQSTPFGKSTMDDTAIKNNVPLASMRDEDPREALLKYADKAEKEPMFTNAWKATQPKTIYADVSDDESDEPKRKRIKG